MINDLMSIWRYAGPDLEYATFVDDFNHVKDDVSCRRLMTRILQLRTPVLPADRSSVFSTGWLDTDIHGTVQDDRLLSGAGVIRSERSVVNLTKLEFRSDICTSLTTITTRFCDAEKM